MRKTRRARPRRTYLTRGVRLTVRTSHPYGARRTRAAAAATAANFADRFFVVFIALFGGVLNGFFDRRAAPVHIPSRVWRISRKRVFSLDNDDDDDDDERFHCAA